MMVCSYNRAHFQGLVASGIMERPLALRGHKRLYPDDNGGDEFGTDQSQEQSVVFVLFLISNNNSYLHKTTINRQNKLVTRVSDSPRVLPKRQRSVLIFSRCPLSRCFTFRFLRLNNLQAGATLVFRFRHFLCPSFCLIMLPLLSLRISHWLSFFLHVSALAASRHLLNISQSVYPLGRPSLSF